MTKKISKYAERFAGALLTVILGSTEKLTTLKADIAAFIDELWNDFSKRIDALLEERRDADFKVLEDRVRAHLNATIKKALDERLGVQNEKVQTWVNSDVTEKLREHGIEPNTELTEIIDHSIAVFREDLGNTELKNLSLRVTEAELADANADGILTNLRSLCTDNTDKIRDIQEKLQPALKNIADHEQAIGQLNEDQKLDHNTVIQLSKDRDTLEEKTKDLDKMRLKLDSLNDFAHDNMTEFVEFKTATSEKLKDGLKADELVADIMNRFSEFLEAFTERPVNDKELLADRFKANVAALLQKLEFERDARIDLAWKQLAGIFCRAQNINFEFIEQVTFEKKNEAPSGADFLRTTIEELATRSSNAAKLRHDATREISNEKAFKLTEMMKEDVLDLVADAVESGLKTSIIKHGGEDPENEKPFTPVERIENSLTVYRESQERDSRIELATKNTISELKNMIAAHFDLDMTGNPSLPLMIRQLLQINMIKTEESVLKHLKDSIREVFKITNTTPMSVASLLYFIFDKFSDQINGAVAKGFGAPKGSLLSNTCSNVASVIRTKALSIAENECANLDMKVEHERARLLVGIIETLCVAFEKELVELVDVDSKYDIRIEPFDEEITFGALNCVLMQIQDDFTNTRRETRREAVENLITYVDIKCDRVGDIVRDEIARGFGLDYTEETISNVITTGLAELGFDRSDVEEEARRIFTGDETIDTHDGVTSMKYTPKDTAADSEVHITFDDGREMRFRMDGTPVTPEEIELENIPLDRLFGLKFKNGEDTSGQRLKDSLVDAIKSAETDRGFIHERVVDENKEVKISAILDAWMRKNAIASRAFITVVELDDLLSMIRAELKQ